MLDYIITQDAIEDISREQLHNTFALNVFAMFYIVQAALKHLKKMIHYYKHNECDGIQGKRTSNRLCSLQGVIVSFTRSLAASLAEKKSE